MENITTEEKARRGVIARLVAKTLRHESEQTAKLALNSLIRDLALPDLFVFARSDGTKHARIVTSEILAMDIPTESAITIANPYLSTKEVIEQVVPVMVEEGLLETSTRRIGLSRSGGTMPVTQYGLTEAGVRYLSTYDQALAKVIAGRLKIQLAEQPEMKDEKKPWASLMPMASRYAEAICHKPEWKR